MHIHARILGIINLVALVGWLVTAGVWAVSAEPTLILAILPTPILLTAGAVLLLRPQFPGARSLFLVVLFVLPIVMHLAYRLGMEAGWPTSSYDNAALGWSIITLFVTLTLTIVYWLSLAVWLGVLAVRKRRQKAILAAIATLAAICALAALAYLLIAFLVFD